LNSYFHAVSSSHKWGGTPNDYLPIHEFIDSSKKIIGDARHRSMYHHTAGCWLAQEIFGVTIQIGKKQIPVREIAERHIIEDLGWLPSPADYIEDMVMKLWMSGAKLKEVGNLNNVFGGKND
jgi:hypothetical protein